MPVKVQVKVSQVLHRFIIGPKGRGIQELVQELDVNVSIPSANEKSDVVTIQGSRKDVEAMCVALEAKVRQLEDSNTQRVSFLCISVTWFKCRTDDLVHLYYFSSANILLS